MANNYANTDTATGLTQALVRIRSENPTGNEQACADFVEGWLRRLEGVEVTVDEVAPGRPNVIARLPGGDEPALAYIAHMDTVPAGEGWTVDPFGGIIREGRLYGRGASDMKGGLAAVMIALRDVAAAKIKPRRDLLVCATVDEEGAGMIGAVRLEKQGLVDASSLLVATEPTGLTLVVAQKGVMWYRVQTRGKMAHAGNPQLGADANHGLALALAELKRRFAALPYDHPQLGRPALTIGQMGGGAKTNVVPDHAWAEVDTRLVPPMTTAEAEEMIREVVEREAAKVPGVSGTVGVVTIDRPPVEARQDSPVVLAFGEAFRQVTGQDVRQAGFPAYTDAAIIAAMTSNPNAVLFGPGHLEQAHTIDEYTPVDEVETAARVLTRTAMLLLAS